MAILAFGAMRTLVPLLINTYPRPTCRVIVAGKVTKENQIKPLNHVNQELLQQYRFEQRRL
jgi:hypothetical protein